MRTLGAEPRPVPAVSFDDPNHFVRYAQRIAEQTPGAAYVNQVGPLAFNGAFCEGAFTALGPVGALVTGAHRGVYFPHTYLPSFLVARPSPLPLAPLQFESLGEFPHVSRHHRPQDLSALTLFPTRFSLPCCFLVAHPSPLPRAPLAVRVAGQLPHAPRHHRARNLGAGGGARGRLRGRRGHGRDDRGRLHLPQVG